jgi:hypothetical protein
MKEEVGAGRRGGEQEEGEGHVDSCPLLLASVGYVSVCLSVCLSVFVCVCVCVYIAELPAREPHEEAGCTHS